MSKNHLIHSSLMNVNEVEKLIIQGRILILSGNQSTLSTLPKGNWIAGSSPYFISESGGEKNLEKIFVIDISSVSEKFSIKVYGPDELDLIPSHYFQNGFSYIIIPAFSKVHKQYAENCYGIKGLFDRPLIGWVSGFDLDSSEYKLGTVYNGTDKLSSEDQLVIMHVELKENLITKAGMINLFRPGNGDIIQFEDKGFRIKKCKINNEVISFANYLHEREVDPSLPLVTYFHGERANVSLKEINLEQDYVDLYAPVFENMDYQIASPVGIYEMEFEDEAQKLNLGTSISCNCILNYLYANLEGKKTLNFTGPVTFGEVQHILLNQTLVYLNIEEKK